jgi:hypothetical protein
MSRSLLHGLSRSPLDVSKEPSIKPSLPRLRQALPLIGLALLAALPVNVVRADPGEEPDLEIKILGMAPGSDRDVQIVVRNLSAHWSTETFMTVETQPAQADPQGPIRIPDLGHKGTTDKETPSEHPRTFTLDKACTGYKMSVVLTKGRNYMEEEEINVTNNVDQMDLCPQGPAAAAEGTGPNGLRAITNAGVDLSDLGKPEWARKGDHTRTIPQVSVQIRESFARDEGLIGGCLEKPFFTGSVIATVFDDGNGCNAFYHRQLVVPFDLHWLREIDRKFIGVATLMVDESDPIGGASCLGPLGIAPSNWATVPTNTIFRDTEQGGVRLVNGPGQLRQWNVSNAIQRPANKDYPELTGFVIRAVREGEDPETDFNCSSKITNFRLKISYLVP